MARLVGAPPTDPQDAATKAYVDAFKYLIGDGDSGVQTQPGGGPISIWGASELQIDVGLTGHVSVVVLTGTADPSAGAGVAHFVGTAYLRDIGSASLEVWVSTGAGDTAWMKLSTASSSGSFLSVAKWA